MITMKILNCGMCAALIKSGIFLLVLSVACIDLSGILQVWQPYLRYLPILLLHCTISKVPNV